MLSRVEVKFEGNNLGGGGNSKVGKMLDGEAEEYESSSNVPPPLLDNFSLQYHHHHHHHHHPSSSSNHIPFNPNNYTSHSHHQFVPHLQSNLFHQIQTQDHQNQIIPPPPFIDSSSGWTDEELLALFNIRSTIHNSFPDQLTWDHVSRKLAELGFKKSAEKCKEKFEDENRSYFKNINSYRFVSELQGLYDQCHDDHGDVVTKDENSKDIVMTKQCDDDDDEKVILEKSKEIRKRKRRDRFEMFKCFCESVVNNMMSQQEQIHNKLLEDILKRDEEKLAKEEAWKKQEMERMNKELDIMAQEQAIASDRQANIIQFFNKYLNGNNKSLKGSSSSSSPSPPTQLHSQNPNYDLPSTRNNNNLESSTTPCSNSNIVIEENPSSSDNVVVVVVPLQQVPSSSSNNNNNNNNPILESNSTCTLVDSRMEEKEDIKRRWPRDEVLALINLKCISSNNNNNVEEKEGNNNDNKGPLWERISQGMLELGYKRNAKRCKEKWENINKYFRKTKDVVNKKKRSLDSRTCPYFHQLSCLYNKQQEKQGGGKLISLHPNTNSADQSSDSPVGSGN